MSCTRSTEMCCSTVHPEFFRSVRSRDWKRSIRRADSGYRRISKERGFTGAHWHDDSSHEEGSCEGPIIYEVSW